VSSERAVEIASRTFPLILAAPSGAGKTTVARRLKERREDIVFSVSATTRPPRPGERDGRDYHFVDEPEFRRMIAAGEFAEWAEGHGHLYGTPLANVTEAERLGRYLILDIDVQGARQIRAAVPEAVGIFILPPSGPELARRLEGRGSEDDAVRARRLRAACRELAEAVGFDFVLVNRDLEATVDAVEAIIASESRRARRMPALEGEIERLCAEIGVCLEAPSSRAPEPLHHEAT
jgi:guanylate kinase